MHIFQPVLTETKAGKFWLTEAEKLTAENTTTVKKKINRPFPNQNQNDAWWGVCEIRRVEQRTKAILWAESQRPAFHSRLQYSLPM